MRKSLQERFDRESKERGSLQASHDGVQKELENLRKHLVQRDGMISAAREKESQMRSQHETKVDELQTKISMLEESRRNALNTMKETEQLGEGRASLLEKSVREKEASIAALQLRASELESRMHAAVRDREHELSELRAQLDSMRDRHRSVLDDATNRTQETENVRSELKAAEDKCASVERELAAERRKIQAMHEKISRLEREAAELETKAGGSNPLTELTPTAPPVVRATHPSRSRSLLTCSFDRRIPVERRPKGDHSVQPSGSSNPRSLGEQVLGLGRRMIGSRTMPSRI